MSEPSATYNPEQTSDLDRMRYALGDIDVTAPFDPDVAYLAKLALHVDWRLAAAAIARSLAARAISAPESFTAVGDMSISWSSRADKWLRIAGALEQAVAAERDRENVTSFGFLEAERADLPVADAEYSNGLRGWR